MPLGKGVRRLLIVLGLFAVLTLASVVMQILPAMRPVMDEWLGRYHTAALLHLSMLAVLLLALLGRLPRSAAMIPLALWLGGLGYWWLDRGRLIDRLEASVKPVAIETSGRPIVLSAASLLAAETVASSLISDYAIDSIHILLNRPIPGPDGKPPAHPPTPRYQRLSLERGAGCEPTRENRARQPRRTPELAARGACVVRDPATLPPVGISVEIGGSAVDSLSGSAGVTPVEVRDLADPAQPVARFDIERVHGPLPLLLPVVNCTQGQPTAWARCEVELARSPYFVDPDPSARPPFFSLATLVGSPVLTRSTIAHSAYFIAGSLGLQRRR